MGRSPPIWAQCRQEICESLEYFRSYQSGVYQKDNLAKGYLLGGFAARYFIFHHGGKFIISHGGGKSVAGLDPKHGHGLRDQTASDKSVRALLKNHTDGQPLVLLADDRYALFPYDLGAPGYTYVVLGVYWISHAWAEYEENNAGSKPVIRWKFAFQWCEDQGAPWWLSNEDDLASLCTPPPSRETQFYCMGCSQESPCVYTQCGMCLHPECKEFWKTNGRELKYSEDFLRLKPRTFRDLPSVIPVFGPSNQYCQGWHCSLCGRLSSRFKWEYWECSHCHVRFLWVSATTAQLFYDITPAYPIGISHVVPALIDLDGIERSIKIETLILPSNRGKIHIISGTPLVNGEADRIFQDYQQQASCGQLDLQRYPLKTVRLTGTLLSQYFSHNSGEPYNYVGATTGTVSLAEAPSCVRDALNLIEERVKLVVKPDTRFNEVLTAAYLENQKMSFHSDDERGVGPVIASLSLGSSAKMRFRHCRTTEGSNQKKEDALSFILCHGDVLVMEGHDVQTHYEHMVIPTNFRIAATARLI
ncbi:hypothetical protein EDD15DRAFT_2129721, partial [Pisolithus albus]